MTLPPNALGTSQSYFSLCLAKIREVYPDFPLDPVILQSILLCLVGGEIDGHSEETSRGCKSLILRTSPEDVGLVLNLATLVSDVLVAVELKPRVTLGMSGYAWPSGQWTPSVACKACFVITPSTASYTMAGPAVTLYFGHSCWLLSPQSARISGLD
jgi:hypothetical protein